MLVFGLSMLALPVDCSGDFGPRGLSVQYTEDVRGCLPAHTGRPWLSVCVCVCPTHKTSVAVLVCPCVSVSTHRTYVGVHQYTYQHIGPWTQHDGPSRGLFGTHRTSMGVRQHRQDVRGGMWLYVSTHKTSVAVRVCLCVSMSVRQHTQDVCGSPSVHISARWSLDSARWPFPWTVWVILAHVGCLFSPYRTSYTQDVRGCLPAHTGRLWLSVAVRQHTQNVCVCPCVSACIRVCPCVSVSTHRTSVGVRHHTQDVRPCPSAHIGRPWLSMCVRVCPSAYTGRPLLSISIHISALVLGLSTLA
ncbi:unnamed protein product, partial [Brassica rapa]